MKTALRTLAAVVAGLIAAFVLVVAVEGFSAVVHPTPEGFDGTAEEMCRHVERYPALVLAVVVAAWGLTAFVGAWVARTIGNRSAVAIVGLLLLAAVVLNISMLPYPMWFKLANLLVVPIAIILGGRPWARRGNEGIHPNSREPAR
jgi:hypothetical protein